MEGVHAVERLQILKAVSDVQAWFLGQVLVHRGTPLRSEQRGRAGYVIEGTLSVNVRFPECTTFMFFFCFGRLHEYRLHFQSKYGSPLTIVEDSDR